jgi:hypothetical protein
MPPRPNRTELRDAVLSALARLRAVFPLERRLAEADADTRNAYTRVLRHWLRGAVPPPELLPPALLARLQSLDAVVPVPEGLGCYPFSARPTGIDVTLAGGTVAAMCAIDALAIARLAGETTPVRAGCCVCGTAIRCRLEHDGGLDHDQTGSAWVAWLPSPDTAGSCSTGLCRQLRFLCPACTAPPGSDVYTLPQAAAVANAFFRFQRELLGNVRVVNA